MATGLESDLLNLVVGNAAFYTPITSALALTIADAPVLARLGYNRLPQNTQQPSVVTGPPAPYLTWKGPFHFDEGQTAVGASGTKKAQFWFTVYHQTLTDAMNWVNDINAAMLAISYPYNLTTFRLTAALFVSKMPIDNDQVQQTSKEYPLSAATIGYTFGFQPR